MTDRRILKSIIEEIVDDIPMDGEHYTLKEWEKMLKERQIVNRLYSLFKQSLREVKGE